MAKPGSARYKDIPLKMAGSTNYARNDKQSTEATWNMIILQGDQDWLSPFAGYNNVLPIDPTGTGRAIYSSTRLNQMFAIIDNKLYIMGTSLGYKTAIGNLNTFTGDCYIVENNAGQLCISDGLYLYSYTDATNVLTQVVFDSSFPNTPIPGYLTFQNGRVIFPDSSTNFWYLSGINNLTFTNSSQTQGSLQTKPDTCQACIRFPGRGNLLLVFGHTVTEQWQDVGAQLFPYQRSQSTNIDYGCINPATIDENEDIICWLAGNEKSGIFIAYTSGDSVKKISTEGIDYKLANLTDPSNCYGFLVRQDGHLIYVATWPKDGLSYAYDFNTGRFFSLSDEYMDAYIAKKVCLFNGKYYFVSIRDGNIYQMSSNIYSYNYGNGMNFEIPRVRIPPPLYLPDQSRFVAGYSGFTIEQGNFDYDYRDTIFMVSTQRHNPIGTQNIDPQQAIGGGFNYRRDVPRVDLCLSKDGGVNFGSNVGKNIRPQGIRQNRLLWWRLGSSNNLVHQFRFYGFGRFLLTDGIVGIHE